VRDRHAGEELAHRRREPLVLIPLLVVDHDAFRSKFCCTHHGRVNTA
jgi:hypothetical protein